MDLRHKYIAIEGSIGVGKTSLAKLLAEKLEGRVVLETIEDNPFISKFYSNRETYAFQTQLFFLLNRYQQQRGLLQRELFDKCVVCDYLFAKDRIFAYLNLDDDELNLYERIYQFLDEEIPKPDLVVYLQASVTMLLERIRKRGQSYEREISEEYLAEVNRSYNDFFFHYASTPLLVVNTDSIDFVNNEDDLEDLINEMKRMKSGTQYYVPALHKR
jgi:deoxyadenosine/deoxycytidine kinase